MSTIEKGCTDRFGAEFAVGVAEYSGGTAPQLWTKGKSAKVFVEGYVDSLGSGRISYTDLTRLN